LKRKINFSKFVAIATKLPNMKTQKISTSLGYAQKKPQRIFSDAEVKVFKTLAGLTLALVAGAGIITLAAVAPNLLSAIGKIATTRIKGKNLTKFQKSKKAVEAVYYLKKSGLIRIRRSPKEIIFSLTKKGRQKLDKINFNILRVKKESKWNGKWWLAAADIPTKPHKRSADLFRKKLKEMGFYGLQRTLWLYPFDPKVEIQFIASHYGIGKYITVMEVNRLDKEDERRLKKHFSALDVL